MRALVSALVVPLVCALLGLAGCSRTGNYYLVGEDYWLSYLDRDGSFTRHLHKLARERGRRLVVMTLERDGHESSRAGGEEEAGWLASAVWEADPELILVSPFQAGRAVAEAKRRPEVSFLVLGAGGNREAVPPNLAFLLFDKAQSYRDAGRIVGTLAAGSLGIGTARKKCGVLSTRSTHRDRTEIDAFRQGFLESAGEHLLVVEALGDTKDRVKIRRAILDLKLEGVTYFCLKTYDLTRYCLDVLQKEGGLAIIENWMKTWAYDDVVFLSIEEDYHASVESALEQARGDASGRRLSLMRGSTRVLWNDGFRELKRAAGHE